MGGHYAVWRRVGRQRGPVSQQLAAPERCTSRVVEGHVWVVGHRRAPAMQHGGGADEGPQRQLLLAAKMVPAVSEVCRRQAVHW